MRRFSIYQFTKDSQKKNVDDIPYYFSLLHVPETSSQFVLLLLLALLGRYYMRLAVSIAQPSCRPGTLPVRLPLLFCLLVPFFHRSSSLAFLEWSRALRSSYNSTFFKHFSTFLSPST